MVLTPRVRADPGQQDTLPAEPGTRPFDMTGRPMKGWIVMDSSDASTIARAGVAGGPPG